MSTNKYSKYVVENVVTGTQIRSIVPAGALDSAAVIDLIDSDYVAARSPAANGFDSADVIGIVDSDYVQARVTLDGVGIDSATAQSIANNEILSTVDSAYVQARQTPQDFAYSSLTGAPTALSSFTNDTNYITAADIPTTVDSDYVQARVTLDGVGLDSAGVTALVDSDYVAARAPAASGGLDSAAVQGVVDDNLLGGVANTGVVIGPSASADTSKLQMTVVGPSAFTNGAYNVAVGRSASVQSGEEFAVAIGNQARAGYSTGGLGGVSIGNQSTVQYDNGVAVGMNAEVKGIGGVALGFDAEVRDTNAIAIGYGPLVLNGQNSISVGRGIIDADNAISISATGAQTTLSGQYSIDIRTSDSGSAVYSIDSDWQFGATVNAPAFVGDGSGLTNLPSGGGGLDSAAVIATMNEEFKITTNQVEIGSGAAATNGAPVAIGRDALAKWTYAVAVGQGAEAGNSTKTADVAIGFQAIASGSESIALGRQTIASSLSSIAIGNNADATNANTLAIGKGANASGLNAVAIGGDNNTSAVGNTSVALGHNAKTGGSSQVAIGDGAGSTTDTSSHAVMIGPNAGALCGQFSSALGYFAQASGGNAVAIGARTRADGLNSIQISATGVQRIISTQYEIDIRTSAAGSLTYDTTNDWTFGAGVTMTDLTASGVVIFSALPTSDPVNAGQLWNDSGTLKVSAG